MKYFSLLLTFLFALSCNDPKGKINSTAFELSEIPEYLYGCSCLFSKTKEEFESEKYIYFDDFGDNCLISIDNKIIFLKPNGNNYSDAYFTAYIQNKIQIDEGYENTSYNAELIIVDKKGNKQIYNVYGLCGC
ncbi:hypothetical protein SAMN04488009_3523 [Maribacter sedimenticola]|uniref:Lipoprotein n=1 Tax=Maribacter sedimenticola TaxID=228956 RepID=A0ABY1SLN6_9FLAO|nr:hypothetical protein [Maribacter sedimenticola]SNR74060.1 hypothetical protein SAMN04488009_3523 [Maribacter sedimenticola]